MSIEAPEHISPVPLPPAEMAPMAAIPEVTVTPRARKMLGALVLYGALHSGGYVDGAMDPFSGTDAVVEAAFPSENDPPVETTTIDGVPFGEFPPKAQAEIRAEDESAREAPRRVKQTMSDLDGGNTEAIRIRAAEFRTAQGDEILSEELVGQYKEQISNASSPEGVVQILDSFMSIYGKKAEVLTEDTEKMLKFDPSIGMGSMRYTADTVISTFAYLPKGFIKEANFTRLVLAGKGGVTAGGGDDNSVDGVLQIAVSHRFNQKLQGPTEALVPNWLWKEGDLRQTILHELGHTKGAFLTGPLEPRYSVARVVEHEAREIINRPEYASQYATKSAYEAGAETFAAAFDISQGPTHPNEVRRFGSRANKDVLAQLASAEINYPGITDYLVSLNPTLMHRQS